MINHKEALEKIISICREKETSPEMVGQIEKIADEVLASEQITYVAVPVESGEFPPYPQIVIVLLDGRMEMQSQIRPGDNSPEWWTLGMSKATNIEANKKCVTHWLKRIR